MRGRTVVLLIALLILLVTSPGIVHDLGGGGTALAQERKGDRRSRSLPEDGPKAAIVGPAQAERLPAPVVEMVDLIRAAVEAGSIEELRQALQWNELPPDVADERPDDPVAYWRGLSSDGSGREVLAAFGAILALAPAVLPLGRDLENNRVYVWPYLAERRLDQLSEAEAADLARLLPAETAAAARASGRYQGWRISIGADGTWHSARQVR
jgi:hypothetical protein